MHSDLRLQFIDWAKQHGHSPATGADAFVAMQADPREAARELGLDCDGDERVARDALRRELAGLAEDTDVAVQFPPVYSHASASGVSYRYSLMLVLAEDCVEWTARVWHGLDYQGMLTGRGAGPRSNYNALARMAVERALDSVEPGYVR